MTAFSDETGSRCMQPFERFKDLAHWVQKLANTRLEGWHHTEWQAFTDELNAALSAAPVAQEPVAIKLLEWRDRGPAVHPQWEAVSVVGSYFIATIKGGQFNWWTTALRGKIEQHSLNDAKDAAQADYEKRIRSALSNPPATPAGVGADEIAQIIATKCFDPRVTTTEERG